VQLSSLDGCSSHHTGSAHQVMRVLTVLLPSPLLSPRSSLSWPPTQTTTCAPCTEPCCWWQSSCRPPLPLSSSWVSWECLRVWWLLFLHLHLLLVSLL